MSLDPELYFDNIIRPNIRTLKPYTCARDEFTGDARCFLDANENALGPALKNPDAVSATLHRYPDPHAMQLKRIYGPKFAPFIKPEHLFVGVGSDEAIDLILRVVCRPGIDRVLTCPPSYAIYDVAAAINDVEVVEVPLVPQTYEVNLDAVADALVAASESGRPIKVIWICAPNNPTGVDVPLDVLDALASLRVCEPAPLVVIDEAYVDFAGRPSHASLMEKHPNVVVLQSFSKSFGLAGARIGVAAGHPILMKYVNASKGSYNVCTPSIVAACQAMEAQDLMMEKVEKLIQLRDELVPRLKAIPGVRSVVPSVTNFLLVEFDDGRGVYEKLAERGVVCRYRGNVRQIPGTIRITVGSAEENDMLVEELENVLAEQRAALAANN